MCGGTSVLPVVKEKRKNSEKRKKLSRDAARRRRSKESEIYSDLANQLPLVKAVQLDKTSIMRLTVGYLKFRSMMEVLKAQFTSTQRVPEQQQQQAFKSSSSVDSYIAEVLHGFLLILTDEGTMLFLSENVDKYLGISRDEMMGQSIFEFSHPYDHDELKSLLTVKNDRCLALPQPTSFYIRMKSILTTKRRNVNSKSTPYKVIHCMGYKVRAMLAQNCENCPAFNIISIAEPVPHPAQLDSIMDKQLFFSRHSPDMKFTDVDESVKEFLGYTNLEMVGKSMFSFYHSSDALALEQCFKTLFQKGQCETGYYRFLAKYGGHVWILTQATIIYDSSTKPECIVCLNYVLSKIENEDEIVSSDQVEAVKQLVVKTATEIPPSESAAPYIPLSSTRSIFTPKEVMSKSFLSFPDADLMMLSETTKDTKLVLDFFDDDLCMNGELHDGPFFSYRDDSLSPGHCGTPDSSVQHSSSSGSPDHFSTTPSTPDSGSLSENPTLDTVDEFNLALKLTMSPSTIDKECNTYEEVTFESRAPYIPMNMDDDFPLITPSNSVMWGPQEPILKKTADDSSCHKPITDQQPPVLAKTKTSSDTVTKSSLAALLKSDVKKHTSRQEKTKSVVHHEQVSNKKWPISLSSESNHRNNGAHKVSSNTTLQKHLPSNRNGTSNGGSGHIIMLDTLPSKKQPITTKSSSYHRKNGHNICMTNANNHSPASSLGSHTATVKVNDRLIKVQVSVSELSTVSIEPKLPITLIPDFPSKRLGPTLSGPLESPKRLKVDNASQVLASAPATESVLLNLLISGEDASRGYLSSGNSRLPEIQSKPPASSLPTTIESNSQNDPLQDCGLLASESELLDSFLNISQFDSDIQSSNLLQGEDLLDALDLTPTISDVPVLV